MKRYSFFCYFALVILLAIGCKPKPIEPSYTCSDNCILMRISGIAKNMETGEGIPNQKIRIYWIDRPCFMCQEEEDVELAEIKTDEKGVFVADVEINSVELNTNDYYILAAIDSNVENHFLFGSYEDYPKKVGYLVHKQGIYSTGSPHLTFDLCPKTTLTLKASYAHQTDAKETAVYAALGKKDYGSYTKFAYNLASLKSKQKKDTAISFTTGAGEFTYIFKGKKTDFSDEWIFETDSIKCESGKNNLYEVNF